MTNKYLEKIAILDLISGYAGANKGDKIGGTVSGGVVGTSAALLGAKHMGPAGMVAGAIGGGYLGGKAYSAAKKAIMGKNYHKK